MQETSKSMFNHYSESRESIEKKHHVQMQNRQKANVTGVEEVISFDNNAIVLDTCRGRLTFSGENLHVKRVALEKGEVDLEGDIDQLKYSNAHATQEAGSFLGKLFR